MQDVLTATGVIIAASGTKPNIGITGWDAYEVLKENTALINRIQYSERGIITPDIIASLFDLDKLYIGKAIYDSAKEGETESQGFVWGADFLLAYKNPRIGLKNATYAITLRQSSFGNPYMTKKWHDDEIDGDWIQVQTMFQHRAVATACAYLFKAVNTQ